MKECVRCGTSRALKHGDYCGCCEIIVTGQFPGAQTASLVPPHFNLGLGEYIEDYDDLKMKRKLAEAEGKVSAWD